MTIEDILKSVHTIKYCPTCRSFPFHGATTKCLREGSVFLTEERTVEWMLNNMTDGNGALKCASKFLGGTFQSGKVTTEVVPFGSGIFGLFKAGMDVFGSEENAKLYLEFKDYWQEHRRKDPFV